MRMEVKRVGKSFLSHTWPCRNGRLAIGIALIGTEVRPTEDAVSFVTSATWKTYSPPVPLRSGRWRTVRGDRITGDWWEICLEKWTTLRRGFEVPVHQIVVVDLVIFYGQKHTVHRLFLVLWKAFGAFRYQRSLSRTSHGTRVSWIGGLECGIGRDCCGDDKFCSHDSSPPKNVLLC